MQTMGSISKWITDTLYADASYTALCTTTVGSALNFYRHSPMNRVEEDMPFLTVFSDELSQNFSGGTEYFRTWSIPIALGINADDHNELDGSTKTWVSVDNAELLAITAVEILRKEASSCGINGESVIILDTRLVVTEIGEADDVQANIFLTFGEENHI